MRTPLTIVMAGALCFAAGCGAVVVDDRGAAQDAGGGDVEAIRVAFDETCSPCDGEDCGLCPILPDVVTHRCSVSAPPLPQICYSTGSVFNDNGAEYVCVLCP